MSWHSYFEKHAEFDRNRPVLPVRSRQCATCPINCMYREIADELRKESTDFRKMISEKWFCHTNPNKACRGNWEFQELEI